MKKKFLIVSILALAAVISGFQQGNAKEITLPYIQTNLQTGKGSDITSIQCNICHSLDYITMQPKGSRAQWAATVTKMRKVMGAPISDADAEVIIGYLADHYGNGK